MVDLQIYQKNVSRKKLLRSSCGKKTINFIQSTDLEKRVDGPKAATPEAQAARVTMAFLIEFGICDVPQRILVVAVEKFNGSS
jgi:hypothetical protein